MAGRRWLAPQVDVLGVVAMSAAVVVLVDSDLLGPPDVLVRVLTLAAVAVGAGAAVLGIVFTRLTDELRPAWISVALVLYCVAVLPGLDGPLVTVAVAAGWAVAAVASVVDGHRRGSRTRTRLGLGFAVLAVAHLYRAVPPVGEGVLPTHPNELAHAALRLLGLALVLVVLARSTSRALGRSASERWRQQEELAVAALHGERAGELAAERDHELRSGLAGLAGITHLLSSNASGIEHDRLRHAVLAELGRLHAILDGGHVPAEGSSADYLVEPVLAGLVALRPANDVVLAVPSALVAHGDSAVLAQIVTNLLANCDRHAPGAPVTIGARMDGSTIVVEVRDEGPGLPPGTEDSVLRRGVRDEAAGGSGLGLHISRRLVAIQGGSLSLRSVTDPHGCLATIIVPMAHAAAPTGPSSSR